MDGNGLNETHDHSMKGGFGIAFSGMDQLWIYRF